MSGLIPGNTYYLAAYAYNKNADGTMINYLRSNGTRNFATVLNQNARSGNEAFESLNHKPFIYTNSNTLYLQFANAQIAQGTINLYALDGSLLGQYAHTNTHASWQVSLSSQHLQNRLLLLRFTPTNKNQKAFTHKVWLNQ